MNVPTTGPTTPSRQLLDLLMRFEGLHRVGKDGLVYPYLCPAGFPTIGYGHLLASMATPAITTGAAELLLHQDASKHLALALSLSPGLANEPQGRLDAIADFVFNLGAGAYRRSTLMKKVNAGDWAAASTEIRKWVWGGGKKLPGLILRREAEAQLLR